MVGDSAAMASFNEDMAKKAKAQVADSAKLSQISAISVMQGRKKWLDKFDGTYGFQSWVKEKHKVISGIQNELSALHERIDKTESNDVVQRCNAKMAVLQSKLDAANLTIDGLKTSYGMISVEDQAPESAAMVNWSKEVSINKKMLVEAQGACDMRATQGYSKETIDSVTQGKAVILGGKIVSEGDFIIADGLVGIVSLKDRNGVSILYRGERSILVKRLAGMTITVHGTKGSDERSDLLKSLVDIDEAAIASGMKDGLFSSYSAEVRGALRSALPSQWMTCRTYFRNDESEGRWFSAPNFPQLIDPKASGEFLSEIIRAQSELVEFKQDHYLTSFRFKDSRKQGETGGRIVWKAVIDWMIANNKKMSLKEASYLNRADFMLARIVNSGLTSACNDLIAKSANITEFNTAMLEWATLTYPWISGIDNADIFENAFGLEKIISNAKAKLDDGSVKYEVIVEYLDLLNQPVFEKMKSAIYKKFSEGAMNHELLAFMVDNRCHAGISNVKSLGKQPFIDDFLHVIQDAVGGKIEGALMDMTGSPFENDLRSFKSLGAGAVIKLRYSDAFSDIDDLTAAIKGFAENSRAERSPNIDMDGYISALMTELGIRGKIAMIGYAKTKDKYSGSYLYPAGAYIRVVIPRGWLQKKMSDRETGLAGRFFDKDKTEWLISLIPAKFSDGNPVADIYSFAEFIALDISKFKKAP